MDEYLAAISRPATPSTSRGGGGGMSLWTEERLKRLGSAVRSLSSRGMITDSRKQSAALIYNEMSDDDPRLSPDELYQFLTVYSYIRRCLTEKSLGDLVRHKSRSSKHQKPARENRRFSPYVKNPQKVVVPRAPQFVWGLKTHRRFLDAVERLGGVEMAAPAAILQVMKAGKTEEADDELKGLTETDIGLHMGKFRKLIGLPAGGSQAGGGVVADSMLDLLGGLTL